MSCKNHPEREATGTCAGCGETFCRECLSRFHEKEYCPACLKGEAALASAHLAGGAGEVARMKRTLIGCSVVLLALVTIPMFLLIYPMFKLGDIGRCRANLKGIFEALAVYAEENEGWFPPDNNDLKPLFEQNLVESTELFYCPGAKQTLGGMEGGRRLTASPQAFPPGSSYLYQGGLRLRESGKQARPVLWDRSPRNHRGKGINVLREDGAVRFQTKGLSRIRLRTIVTDPAEGGVSVKESET